VCPEKNLSEQSREPQQTQPTYDARSGNRTRDTLVVGERSHHCALVGDIGGTHWWEASALITAATLLP